MAACADNALLRILSYECCAVDVAVNYLMVLWATGVSSAAVENAIATPKHSETAAESDAEPLIRDQAAPIDNREDAFSGESASRNTLSNDTVENNETVPKRHMCRVQGVIWGINAYLWAFQIGLCMAVGCVGISVVWSAQAGIVWALKRRHDCDKRGSVFNRVKRSFALACCAVWVYYAIKEPPITSVAHAAAFLMGVAISFLLPKP
mmetsp:Transcript_4909/g.10161  ORF Transcript_4909/g.10161 Transcript_4909/m.10161 type:complete len:207 (-) Transcript_4909:166-786(-)